MLNIQQSIPLAPYTTFKIGGAAKYFIEVSTEEALLEALKYAQENSLAVFILAGGSNILVSDDGFDGLIIKITQDEIGAKLLKSELSSGEIECWAGNSLSSVVNFCAKNNLTGLEWAAGIPGTIGGAVRGNAGAYGLDTGKLIKSVKALKINGSSTSIMEVELPSTSCQFSYRNSIFKQDKNLVIISVVLKLQKGDKIEIENKIKEIAKKRAEKIPAESSAGSFFENPVVADKNIIERFEKDTGSKNRDGKIPAGWLIEEAGLRGKKMGRVAVSEKHGNFVVNLGGGTAQEVVMLVSLIKMKVRDEFGVQLKEEVQYVGF